jgi:hypothetical protein
VFGDAITGDHKIINEDDASRDHDKTACIIQDRPTNWLQAYAAQHKSAAETKKAVERFLGPQGKAKHAYTDNIKEFLKTFEDLGIPHDTSTPYRPETNGVAERAVRRVKEGTSCTLSQSGFSDEWWVYAMNCFCFLRCVVDQLRNGQTAFQQRFGIEFKGPCIPFGAEIRYYPITTKDKARLHGFGNKTLDGIFLGYQQQAGGGWSGDLLILDWEEIRDA